MAHSRLRRPPRLPVLSRRALALVAFALGSAGTVAVSTLSRSFAVEKEANATTAQESPYDVVAQLARVLVLVENAYVEPVERTRLLNGAVKGMVAELDPHSSYLPAREWALFSSETEGKFGGLGLEVDGSGDALTVLAPIEGAPAFRAGIRAGDRIVAVDGEDAQGIGLGRMIEHMRGAPGTHVKLTIQRPGKEDLTTYDLAREIVHVPSVTSRRLAENIAYVRVKQFQEGTHDELVEAAARLRREGGKNALTGVILDMRGNPGGLVDEASALADEFLDGGTLYTMRHRGQVIEEEKAHGGGAFASLPIVILMSEYSASAAELVAGALQDNRRALVAGENSYGKGSVQSLLELPGGAGLRLTTARYYTPSGHAIQADGIHPDLYIPSPVNRNALPVMRERDLEGHLAAENAAPPNAAKPSLADHPQITVNATDAGASTAPSAATSDAGTKPPHATVEGSFAEEVPVDPSLDDADAQLKGAYRLLRDQLVGRGPIVK